MNGYMFTNMNIYIYITDYSRGSPNLHIHENTVFPQNHENLNKFIVSHWPNVLRLNCLLNNSKWARIHFTCNLWCHLLYIYQDDTMVSLQCISINLHSKHINLSEWCIYYFLNGRMMMLKKRIEILYVFYYGDFLV